MEQYLEALQINKEILEEIRDHKYPDPSHLLLLIERSIEQIPSLTDRDKYVMRAHNNLIDAMKRLLEGQIEEALHQAHMAVTMLLYEKGTLKVRRFSLSRWLIK